MKNMKSVGGLTHGHGISDNILSMRIIGMTALQHVCDEVEDFSGVAIASCKQHLRISGLEWLDQHNPFPETPKLISISSGAIGDSRINCHKPIRLVFLALKEFK